MEATIEQSMQTFAQKSAINDEKDSNRCAEMTKCAIAEVRTF